MTHTHEPSPRGDRDEGRAGPPTVREIAALTARLRGLARPGAAADSAAREAFLADKQALLDRIVADHHPTGPRAAHIPDQTQEDDVSSTNHTDDSGDGAGLDGPVSDGADMSGVEAGRVAGALSSEAKHASSAAVRTALTQQASHPARYAAAQHAAQVARPEPAGIGLWQARDGEGRVVATFDPADAYSAAEITAIADAHARGNHTEAERLQQGRPHLTPPEAATPTVNAPAGDPPWAAEGITYEGHVAEVSWAVAARDAAIERGDTTAAARFARQAREALDAAEDAGIDYEQLADELDYPGGAAELDGEHIDLSIDSEPITAAELARRDSEFDALCERHPIPEDPADVAIDVDDPGDVAWWAPVGPAEETISHSEAARRLTERGFTPERAQTMVVEYLDETSRRVGSPVHQWGMDDHDVQAIAHTARPHEASPRATAAGSVVEPDGDETDRRAQLARWHDDDQATAAAEYAEDGPVLATSRTDTEEQ